MRRIRTALAASALALAAGAQAAPAATFGVSVGGTQVTQWSYQGRLAGSCDVPVTGHGEQKIDFRTTRPAKAAINRSGRYLYFTANPTVDASGYRTGELVTHNSADAECTGEPDRREPQKGCGRKHYRLDQVLVDAGLNAPRGDVRVQAATSQLPIFNGCPWFSGPDSQSYIDDQAPGGAVNHDVYGNGGGRRYTRTRLPARVLRLRPGRSLTLPMGRTKVYRFHDDHGDLHGETRLTLHLVLRRCRVASFATTKC